MPSADEQEDFLQHGRFGEGERPIPESVSATAWKCIAGVGICSIVIGIATFYIDFRLEFLDGHFNVFLIAVAIGVVASFIGLIGWARLLKRGARLQMASLVFASPFIMILLGYPIAGFNVHGPSALVSLLIVPASILAMILLITARMANPRKD